MERKSMWEGNTSPIRPGVSKISIQWEENRKQVSFRNFFDLCGSDAAFADFLTGHLIANDLEGFFWELPAIANEELEIPFECVLIDGPVLRSLRADPKPFAPQFSKAVPDQTVVVFQNLGGDATLISPIPVAEDLNTHSHFAAFLRGGPRDQIRELWKSIGDTASGLISSQPFWLSTAGLGVSWLHLRFDSRPKYYRHQPYKKA